MKRSILAMGPGPAACLALLLTFALGISRVELAGAQEPPAGGAERPLLETVVVLGASVSDGYGNHGELKTRCYVPFGTFLAAFLTAPESTAFVELGDSNLFWNADILGARHLSRALAAEPSAVVAVDYLFWYAFGHGRGLDARRDAGLELGLARLERIDAPLVIADLPDVRLALEGRGPFGMPIIARSQIPTEEERARFNARIHAWADERPNVHIVSLADFLEDAVELAPLELRGNAWTPTEHTDILQPDLLHPTKRGTLWLALGVLDALADAGGLAPEAVDWDLAAASERFDASIEPLRRTHGRRSAAAPVEGPGDE